MSHEATDHSHGQASDEKGDVTADISAVEQEGQENDNAQNNDASNRGATSSLRNVMQSVLATGVNTTRNALNSLQQRIRERNRVTYGNTYNPHENDIAPSDESISDNNNNNNDNNNINLNNNDTTTLMEQQNDTTMATTTASTNNSNNSNNSNDNMNDDSCNSDSESENESDSSKNDNNKTNTETDSKNDDASIIFSKEKMENIFDELTCHICRDIYYEPLTIVCGHTFCRQCLSQLLSKCEKKCPLCRTICMINTDLHCVNLTIQNLIIKLFPKKYKLRKKEFEKQTNKKHNKNKSKKSKKQLIKHDKLAMFVLDMIRFPSQILSLHLYENRYLHMINRVVSSDRHFGYLCRPIGKNDNTQDEGYRPYENDIGLFVKVIECQFLPNGRCLLEAKCLNRIRVTNTWVERGTQGLWYAECEDYYDSPLTDLKLTDDKFKLLNDNCDELLKFVEEKYNSCPRHILARLEASVGERINLSRNEATQNYGQWSFFVFGLILAFNDESSKFSTRDLFRSQNFAQRIDACCKMLKH